MAAPPISWSVPMRAIGAQNLLTMPGGVSTSGYLHKKGGNQFSMMKWPLRFIIIHEGCIYYFKSSTSSTPQGAFSLSGYNRVLRAAEETTSNNVFPFKIVHISKRHRTWYFSAASEDERKKWMRDFRREINHYNNKKDLTPPPREDLDSNDIYKTLEEPLEINSTKEDPDYESQDEDSDQEDSPLPAGRSVVPPPPYPPPPVPVQPFKENRSLKGPPPPLPPPFLKPSFSAKSLPPPLPPAPHLIKPGVSLPLLPPPVSSIPSGPFFTMPACEKKSSTKLIGKSSATLPIVKDVQNVFLHNGNKASISCQYPQKVLSPRQSTSINHKPLIEIPKPPLPHKPKPDKVSFQRASPDGQSFRSSIEEKPTHKRVPERIDEDLDDDDDDDDDYENVRLPSSVFMDTVDTANVERIFRETYNVPPNGVYSIRKSGTGKTSQVLVVWDSGINKARNYRLFEEEQRVYLEPEIIFPDLHALIEHYHIHPLPSSNNSMPNFFFCLQVPFHHGPST